jgi:hypothetical protein
MRNIFRKLSVSSHLQVVRAVARAGRADRSTFTADPPPQALSC